jgi:hypothetical protein
MILSDNSLGQVVFIVKNSLLLCRSLSRKQGTTRPSIYLGNPRPPSGPHTLVAINQAGPGCAGGEASSSDDDPSLYLLPTLGFGHVALLTFGPLTEARRDNDMDGGSMLVVSYWGRPRG